MMGRVEWNEIGVKMQNGMNEGGRLTKCGGE